METIWNGGNSSKGRWEIIIKRKQLYLEKSKLQTFKKLFNSGVWPCKLKKQLWQISENFRKPLKFQQIGKVCIDCITNVTNPLRTCQILMALKLNSNYHSFFLIHLFQLEANYFTKLYWFSHHMCLRISSHVLVDQKLWVLWFVFSFPTFIRSLLVLNYLLGYHYYTIFSLNFNL